MDTLKTPLAPSDAELVRRFDDGTLDEFHHVHHVQVAWAYLELHGTEDALRLFPAALLRLATRKGAPEKFDPVLTRTWLLAIDAARRAHPDARTAAALVEACPALLDRSTVERRPPPV